MPKVHSCLYECRVTHSRSAPVRNAFTYSTFLFRLDLDELPRLTQSLRLLGHGKSRLFSLRDVDHFKFRAHEAGTNLRARVESEMRRAGLEIQPGRIELVTACRFLGYVFNPVSFFYIYAKGSEERVAAVLVEVNNTFGEQKPYWIVRGSEGLRGRARKDFYVSPFIDHDLDFVLDLRDPHDELFVRIDSKRGNDTELSAVLRGKRRELTDRGLFRAALRRPFPTLMVMACIHYQALKLYLRRVPFFGKQEMDERIRRTAARPEPTHEIKITKNKSRKTA